MSQAARLLSLRTDTLRRWIDGYERTGTTYAPVIREERTGIDTVTWGEFVEADYLREYRAKQATLQYLRPVIAILREELGVRYPLATLKPYTSDRTLAPKVQNRSDSSRHSTSLSSTETKHYSSPTRQRRS
jgi:hypothetical protein